MADSSPSSPVLLGIVGGAHGLKGECRVSSFTADPRDLGAYGPLFDAKGGRYTVLSARAQKNVVVARFEEVRDRDHAERLNGVELFVERSALPEEEDDDDFYIADLIGLSVVALDGSAVGEVVAVHDFGAGDILEIRPERGASVLIPFSEAAVPEVDLDKGEITVEPVAAGLAEAEPDEGGTEDDEPKDERR